MPRSLIPASLVPVAQNTYWREHDAELILSVWAQSGLTLSAFGRQCGLSVTRLRRWKKRLEQSDAPRFHPVEVVEPREVRTAADASSAGLEVIVGADRRVVVRAGFDRALLRELIETLEAC